MDEKQLFAALEAATAELGGIAAKGHGEITDTDLARAETLRSEIADLRNQIETGRARADRLTALQASHADAARFLETPQRPTFSGHPADTPASSVPVGTQPAGQTTIGRRADGSYEVSSTGAGLLSQGKWLRLSRPEYQDAHVAYLMAAGDMDRMSSTQRLALQEGIDDQGGYLFPPEFVMQLIRREPTPTAINPFVQRWQTMRDAVLWPKLNYTGATDDPNAVLYSTGVRVTYPGELPAADTTIDTTEPAFGELRLDVHTAMMALSLGRNLLDDSPISVMSLIEQAFRETDDLELDNRILNGTGVGQAAGILRNPNSGATANEPQYLTSGAAAALTADGIKSLAFGLAPQYLRNARFAMNWLSTAQAIDKLKDGDGNYLWSMGVQDNRLAAGILDKRLLGFPVSYSEFLPSVAANTFPIIFGDLGSYILVERLGISIEVLRETKAKRNQVEIIARRRFGGGVARPWGLKVLKVAA